jgi:hypothetical protein
VKVVKVTPPQLFPYPRYIHSPVSKRYLHSLHNLHPPNKIKGLGGEDRGTQPSPTFTPLGNIPVTFGNIW